MKRLTNICTALLASALGVVALGGCAMSAEDPEAIASWSDGQYAQRDPSSGNLIDGRAAPAQSRPPVIATGLNPADARRPGEQTGKPQPVPYVPGSDDPK